MKLSSLIKVAADKVGAAIVGVLFVVSFDLAPLIMSLHFFGNNHFLFFIVFTSLMIAVGFFWVRLARWRRWPADKYAGTSKSDPACRQSETTESKSR